MVPVYVVQEMRRMRIREVRMLFIIQLYKRFDMSSLKSPTFSMPCRKFRMAKQDKALDTLAKMGPLES